MEDEKCPVCGSRLFNMDTHWSCLGCKFDCAHKDLPRIAAAMDLARATYFDANAVFPDGFDLKSSRECVLEVFGGERCHNTKSKPCAPEKLHDSILLNSTTQAQGFASHLKGVGFL